MSNIKLAFSLGVAFGLGRAWAKSKNMALDADKWITIHPNGKGEKADGSGNKKGVPVLIDESGTIKAGLGGKYTGKNIRQNWSKDNTGKQPAQPRHA